MKQMGGLSSLMDKLPAAMAAKAGQVDMDRAEKDIRRKEGIIHSMTPLERRKPELIKATRKRRIAQGAGVQVQEVNRMLKEFEQMQDMMKKMKGGGMMKMMKRMAGMKGMKGCPACPSRRPSRRTQTTSPRSAALRRLGDAHIHHLPDQPCRALEHHRPVAFGAAEQLAVVLARGALDQHPLHRALAAGADARTFASSAACSSLQARQLDRVRRVVRATRRPAYRAAG
jgi:hypothetical protein